MESNRIGFFEDFPEKHNTEETYWWKRKAKEPDSIKELCIDNKQ